MEFSMSQRMAQESPAEICLTPGPGARPNFGDVETDTTRHGKVCSKLQAPMGRRLTAMLGKQSGFTPPKPCFRAPFPFLESCCLRSASLTGGAIMLDRRPAWNETHGIGVAMLVC
jgi:hypothetical protein